MISTGNINDVATEIIEQRLARIEKRRLSRMKPYFSLKPNCHPMLRCSCGSQMLWTGAEYKCILCSHEVAA